MTIVNAINPDNPVQLADLERACQLAVFYRLVTVMTIRVADGQPLFVPDETLGDAVSRMWKETDGGTRARFVQDAYDGILAARYDAETAKVLAPRAIATGLRRDDKIIGQILPSGRVAELADAQPSAKGCGLATGTESPDLAGSSPAPAICIYCSDAPALPGSDYCSAGCVAWAMADNALDEGV